MIGVIETLRRDNNGLATITTAHVLFRKRYRERDRKVPFKVEWHHE
ncbi:MAG: Hypothetical protein AJITA_00585 [Acetilactobacillus jinshanensis]